MASSSRLSLERPYKDEKGEHVLNVLDITSEGELILESRENARQRLGDDFRRIFVERDVDFFDQLKKGGIPEDVGLNVSTGNESMPTQDEETKSVEPMTPERLLQMRKDILPQLHVAHGEMSQARDLLSVLVTTSTQADLFPELPAGSLKSIVVSKPPDIPSVQAFNAQLVVSNKDEALRKASTAFKVAADSMERVRSKSEKYWLDALKIRHANWGLVAAPLPPGAPSGKSADKSARDFWITFGLTESPVVFKQKALAHLDIHGLQDKPIIFPRHSSLRMRVTLINYKGSNRQRIACDTWSKPKTQHLNNLLDSARIEIVDQEIFSKLIKEAAILPTAAVKVSERLIVVELAQDSELRFELVDHDLELEPEPMESMSKDNAICDLIHTSLVVLLLRAHRFTRHQRLTLPSVTSVAKQRIFSPQLLLPVVNTLQYKLFCERVKLELLAVGQTLTQAGISNKIRFKGVGEAGVQLVDLLRGEERVRIGGDAIMRVNNSYTLHFTFTAPSNLVVVLPQATLTITSVPQLYQLVRDEIEQHLLQTICKVGRRASEAADGSWFVDKLSNRAVGRWETTVLTFKIYFGNDDTTHLSCVLVEVRGNEENKTTQKYNSNDDGAFLSWVQQTITQACS